MIKLILAFLLLVTPCLANEPAPWKNDANLVGYWKLNEASGTITDSSVSGNSGTATSVTYNQRGVFGRAIKFDGTASKIVGSNSPYNFGDTTFTVTAWIKCNNANGSVAAEGGFSGGWLVGTNATVPLIITKGSGGDSMVVTGSTTIATDNKWHHVAYVITTSTTVTNNNTAIIYVDGVSETLSFTKTRTYLQSLTNWSIGSRAAGASSFFSGLIDDVRIYSDARTATEVYQDYLAGLQVKSGGDE
jgi:hypothetical protein